ncbi:hypothetical protein [Ancylobacter vacuolatus]|uniref:Uncharacterized protein n=1 Tax=Ancylobacter vacuolatus TaxID=223389 RepID=A0ABU0DMU6_9HYPH|nr:hypothetical protein [Ancylobacter vacuolatus]MDQ0349772.1 hypothetical protein [Ancylobacter vacuolatus]
MSKNSRRHRRAYVAGARDGIARLRGAIAPLLTAEARPALDRLAATITAEFPMPPVWRHPNTKVPARGEEEGTSHG